ncbi:DUF1282 family protein [Photobacterium damselae]|nr:DUF1282 family protein [Photobacterium damselae]
MTPSKNPLIAVLDLFRSPIDCFAAVYERPKWAFFAYLIIIFGPFILWGGYFDHVDMPWLQQSLAAQLSNVDHEIQQAWMTKEVLLAGEVFSDVLGRTAMIFLLALWLYFSTKASTYSHGYGKWLAASCFIMLPAFLGDIASYVNILFNTHNILPNAADLNSLNGLLKLPLNSPWSPFATTIPLLTPWYIALTYATITAWTDYDRAKAVIVALLPWVMTIIIWPIMILVSR